MGNKLLISAPPWPWTGGLGSVDVGFFGYQSLRVCVITVPSRVGLRGGADESLSSPSFA